MVEMEGTYMVSYWLIMVTMCLRGPIIEIKSFQTATTLFCLSRSSDVKIYGGNGKLIYDFLLVGNVNEVPKRHH